MITHIYVLSLDKDCPTVRWLEQYKFKNYTVVTKGKSLSHKREDVLRKQAKNTWCFMMLGNIHKVTGMHPMAQGIFENPTKEQLSHEYSPKELLQLVNFEVKQDSDSYGGSLIGFASNENHFFRKHNHSSVGFVWGKMVVMKNSGFKWRHDLIGMEDYAFTAECLLHDGTVWINKWVYPHSKRPDKVTAEARLKSKIFASKILVEQYKGLFRYNDKPNLPANSEIQMRFHSINQIMKWRSQFKTKTYQRS